jgi:hypothetical protein
MLPLRRIDHGRGDASLSTVIGIRLGHLVKPALLLIALLLPLAPILDALPHRCGHDADGGHIHIGQVLVALDAEDRPLPPAPHGDPGDDEQPHHCHLAAADAPMTMAVVAVPLPMDPAGHPALASTRPDGPAYPPDPPPVRAI